MTMPARLIISVTDHSYRSGEAQLRTSSVQATAVPFSDALDLESSELTSRAEAKPFNAIMTASRASIVKQCGEALCNDLRQNKRIERSLDTIVKKPGVRIPIYVRLNNAPTENLPWEALWDSTLSFLALNKTVPIARLGAGKSGGVTWIEPALRVLIVLAAAPKTGSGVIDTAGEWNLIWPQLDALGQQVRVHVITGHSGVADQIEAMRDVRVSCERLTSGGLSTIDTAITTFVPNIVHFFCHGISEGAPRLELATVSDYDACATSGSIQLNSGDVVRLGKADSVWLIALNCCQGSHAGDRAKSMAGLVAENGVPAVVAMRENVDSQDAHLFAESFYKNLLMTLQRYLPTDAAARNGAAISIPESVWLDAMHPPRAQLSTGRVPEDDPQWTLPVIYVQDGGLQLTARPRSGVADVAALVAAAPAASISTDPAVASLPPAPTDVGGATVATTGDSVQIETKGAKLKSELSTLETLVAELKALSAPAEAIAAFEARITEKRLELQTLERETLTQALDILKGSSRLTDELRAQFETALDRLT